MPRCIFLAQQLASQGGDNVNGLNNEEPNIRLGYMEGFQYHYYSGTVWSCRLSRNGYDTYHTYTNVHIIHIMEFHAFNQHRSIFMGASTSPPSLGGHCGPWGLAAQGAHKARVADCAHMAPWGPRGSCGHGPMGPWPLRHTMMSPVPDTLKHLSQRFCTLLAANSTSLRAGLDYKHPQARLWGPENRS